MVKWAPDWRQPQLHLHPHAQSMCILDCSTVRLCCCHFPPLLRRSEPISRKHYGLVRPSHHSDLHLLSSRMYFLELLREAGWALVRNFSWTQPGTLSMSYLRYSCSDILTNHIPCAYSPYSLTISRKSLHCLPCWVQPSNSFLIGLVVEDLRNCGMYCQKYDLQYVQGAKVNIAKIKARHA